MNILIYVLVQSSQTKLNSLHKYLYVCMWISFFAFEMFGTWTRQNERKLHLLIKRVIGNSWDFELARRFVISQMEIRAGCSSSVMLCRFCRFCLFSLTYIICGTHTNTQRQRGRTPKSNRRTIEFSRINEKKKNEERENRIQSNPPFFPDCFSYLLTSSTKFWRKSISFSETFPLPCSLLFAKRICSIFFLSFFRSFSLKMKLFPKQELIKWKNNCFYPLERFVL